MHPPARTKTATGRLREWVAKFSHVDGDRKSANAGDYDIRNARSPEGNNGDDGL